MPPVVSFVPSLFSLFSGLTSGSLAAAGKLMQDGISSTQLLQMLLHREKLLYQVIFFLISFICLTQSVSELPAKSGPGGGRDRMARA